MGGGVRGRFEERVSMHTHIGEREREWPPERATGYERHFAYCTKAPIEGFLGADNVANLHPAQSTQRGYLFFLAQSFTKVPYRPAATMFTS